MPPTDAAVLSRALRGRFVSVELLDREPHPELAPGQRPAVSELAEAAAVLGCFPDGAYCSDGVRVSLLTL
jgi:hypothetical protein